jgi:hypothetical protein
MPPSGRNACRGIDRLGSTLEAFHMRCAMATVCRNFRPFAIFMAEGSPVRRSLGDAALGDMPGNDTPLDELDHAEQ